MKCEVIFDVAQKSDELKKLQEVTAANNFWDDNNKAKETIEKVNILKSWVDPCRDVGDELLSLTELNDLSQDEPEGSSIFEELSSEIVLVEKKLEQLEFKKMLGGPLDGNNAFLSINAGAGGTESCDWAEMLLRMYKRWAERRGFSAEITDILAGEEAGIKNVTLLVKGEFAYGYLNAERGVHRLVRISPFDSNKRRHTSFASIDVIPEVNDEIEIEIDEKDLRIDTYRAGGAGGQKVNKTDSAVRITHIPTNIVAQCQNERSQFQNKATCLKILKARLYEKKEKEKREQLAKEYGEKMDIAWGSQIRSYVFHPYQMVKDHRTDMETSNTQAVMDGDIDMFIEEYLKALK
ncbi:MAG: peptide chain release factor 2 [Candidatus Ancaeobacter aquaticus]|nr:peptide chain release factor 2 [Candidatus Ancaeobacter aquaticus]